MEHIVGDFVVRPFSAAHRFYDEHRERWTEATGLSEAEMENRAGGYGLKWIERGGSK